MPEDFRPPYRIQFDNARDPYSARNALGITGTGGSGGGLITSVSPPLSVTGGNLTIDLSGLQPLDADLTSIAGYGGTGTWLYRSAANTWSPVTVSTGLSFSGGVLTCTVSTAGFQPLDATLTALAAFNTNGLLTQTAPDTFTGRTLTGPAAGITVSNGNGVAGNPTLALANDLAALEALAGTNTIPYRSGADTWAGVTVGTGLTFTGGTLAASAAAGGVVGVLRIFAASGSYVPTAGTRFVIIECVGGGGAGGRASSGAADSYQGGGGGAGAYARHIATAATIGASQTVTIGAGGAVFGASGGTTSFGSIASAGGGGAGAESNVGALPTGGLGGATGTGAVVVPGTGGGWGFFYAGSSPNSYSYSGNGAPGPFGGGARSPTIGAVGQAGQGYGSGGSGGARHQSSSTIDGGAGAPGVVIITEFA